MTDFVKKHKIGVALDPQDASPSNPVEGQLQTTSSSHSTLGEGLYIYTSSAWVRVGNAGTSPSVVTTQTLDYTALTTDDIILMNNSIAKTVTLPAASGNTGLTFRIKKINSADAGEVTIDANASETIDGSLTVVLHGQYQTIDIVCDGSNWHTMVPPKPLIGSISHQVSSGTASGTFTSGSYQTRPLNGSDGDFSKFGTLSSNQITLDAGTYHVNASANSYQVDVNRLRFQNTSDASTVIFGVNANARSASVAPDTAELKGTFTITATKTFELQHRGTTTRASDGFGVNASFGDTEVYATIEITKLV